MPLRGEGDSYRRKSFFASSVHSGITELAVIDFVTKEIEERGTRPLLNVRVDELTQHNERFDKDIRLWLPEVPKTVQVGGVLNVALRPSPINPFEFKFRSGNRSNKTFGDNFSRLHLSGVSLTLVDTVIRPDLEEEDYQRFTEVLPLGTEVEISEPVIFTRVNEARTPYYAATNLPLANLLETIVD